MKTPPIFKHFVWLLVLNSMVQIDYALSNTPSSVALNECRISIFDAGGKSTALVTLEVFQGAMGDTETVTWVYQDGESNTLTYQLHDPDTDSFETITEGGIFREDGDVKVRKLIASGTVSIEFSAQNTISSDNRFQILVTSFAEERFVDAHISDCDSHTTNPPNFFVSVDYDQVIGRHPVHLFMALDGSGSMAGDKWLSLKSSVTTLMQFLGEYSNAGLLGNPNDQVGYLIFGCSPGTSPTTPNPDDCLSDITPNIRDLDLVTASGHIQDEIQDKPDPGSFIYTPIWKGVLESWNELRGTCEDPDNDGDTSDNICDDVRNIVLLMTDGYRNRGIFLETLCSSTGLCVDSSTDCPNIGTTDNELSIKFKTHTIGLGKDEQIEPGEIRDWACQTGGDYRITDSTNFLKAYFAEIFGTVFGMDRIQVEDPTTSPNITISGGATAMILFVEKDPTSTVDLVIKRQNGGSFDSPIEPDPNAEDDQYAIWTLEAGDAVPGTWFFCKESSPANSCTSPLPVQNVLAFVNPDVESDFGFERVRHVTGDFIEFHADIHKDGFPIDDAIVEVAINAPDEGIGNILATNPPPPSAYVSNRDYNFGRGGRLAVLPNNLPAGTTAAVVAQPPQNTVDSIDGLDARLRHVLFALGDRDVPEIDTQNFRIQLYDDGTHGDPVAGDGHYHNSFGPIQYEGSLQFNFLARNSPGAQIAFAREFNLSERVYVGVSLENTDVDTRVVDRTKRGVVTAEIRVIPRDIYDRKKGPYRAGDIAFEVLNGRFSGAIVDNLDGSYSQLVTYIEGVPPVVKVYVDDILVDERVVRPGGPLSAALFIAALSYDQSLNLDRQVFGGGRAVFAPSSTPWLAFEVETLIGASSGDSRDLDVIPSAGLRITPVVRKAQSLFFTAGASYWSWTDVGNPVKETGAYIGLGLTALPRSDLNFRIDLKDYVTFDAMDADTWYHNVGVSLSVTRQF